MEQEATISVEGVSKKFVSSLRKSIVYGVRDVAGDCLGLSTHSEVLRSSEFWAVRDVTFGLKPGDTIGIVGPNGSGKSTLLKMLNGIIKPDIGRIRIRGRVGALIEVGAGFHPMLSGRENIHVNGTILGMSRAEIRRKFDSIVDFAEVGQFLDMPVKFYSSGMYVRLGFAVAAHCEPDILLVDEVLAVGDVGFQRKCFNYFEENVLARGTILCLVSHNIHLVAKLCNRALLLDKGAVKYDGPSSQVVQEYYKTMRSISSTSSSNGSSGVRLKDVVGDLSVVSVDMTDKSGTSLGSIVAGAGVQFRLSLNAAHEMPDMPPAFLKISDLGGAVMVYSIIPEAVRREMRVRKGENVLGCYFPSLALMPGTYTLEVKLGGGGYLVQDLVQDARIFEVVAEDEFYGATAGGYGMVYTQSLWHCE